MPHHGAAGPHKKSHGTGRAVQMSHPWDKMKKKMFLVSHTNLLPDIIIKF